MKLRLKGLRSHGKLCLSGNSKEFKKIDPFFYIEIDTKKIKKRKKGE